MPTVTLVVRLPCRTRATSFNVPEHGPPPVQVSFSIATLPFTLAELPAATIGLATATALLAAVLAPAPLPAVTEHTIELPRSAVCNV